MSAEAPKQSGAELKPSQTGGFLPIFLRKLFDVPLESQLPSGLEGFASKIQQGIANYDVAQRQQALEIRSALIASISAEAARKAEIAQKQRELEQKSALAWAEARQILGEFQVEKRLKYIQRAVWGGKGKIIPIEPKFGVSSMGYTAVGLVNEYDKLGGFELVHQYPLFALSKQTIQWSEGSSDEWQYEPKTGNTSISVVVLRKLDSEEDEKVLSIHSEGEIGRRKEGTFVHDPHYFTYDFAYKYDDWRGLGSTEPTSGSGVLHVNIPVATQESTALLDSALAQEANYRITNGLLPSQLEESARKVLGEVKQRPCWMKWTRNRNNV